MGHGEQGCPWPGAKAKTSSQGQDVVFREATLQAAREILEPHNFMCFQWALSLLILVPSLVQHQKAWSPMNMLPLSHCVPQVCRVPLGISSMPHP